MEIPTANFFLSFLSLTPSTFSCMIANIVYDYVSQPPTLSSLYDEPQPYRFAGCKARSASYHCGYPGWFDAVQSEIEKNFTVTVNRGEGMP